MLNFQSCCQEVLEEGWEDSELFSLQGAYNIKRGLACMKPW